MASVTLERRDLVRFRKCVVDGKSAYFHTWGSDSKYVPGRGIITSPIGIVEFEDGTIECVEPEEIRFTERHGERIELVFEKED